MRFRKPRIAFSAACLVAYVLLIAFWVRSYFAADYVVVLVPKHRVVDIGSDYGVLRITTTYIRSREFEPNISFLFGENPAFVDYWGFDRRPDDLGRERVAIKFPHWFAMLLAFVIAALPWLRSGQLPKTERPTG